MTAQTFQSISAFPVPGTKETFGDLQTDRQTTGRHMSILCVLLMTAWANWPSFKKDGISTRLDPAQGKGGVGASVAPRSLPSSGDRPDVPRTSCQNSTQGSQIPTHFPLHPLLLDKPRGLWTVSRPQKRGLKPDWEKTSGTL